MYGVEVRIGDSCKVVSHTHIVPCGRLKSVGCSSGGEWRDGKVRKDLSRINVEVVFLENFPLLTKVIKIHKKFKQLEV